MTRRTLGIAQSRDWPPIERLPERPGVAVMTSGGYWRDGTFYPTHRASAPVPMAPAKRRWRWF